jgi:hypothetical protein
LCVVTSTPINALVVQTFVYTDEENLSKKIQLPLTFEWRSICSICTRLVLNESCKLEFSSVHTLLTWDNVPKCRQLSPLPPQGFATTVYQKAPQPSKPMKKSFIKTDLISIRHCRVRKKARLHLQLSLWFLVQFSPFDGCKQVNQLRMFKRGDMHALSRFVINLLVHIYQKEKIAAKIASVNGPLKQPCFVKLLNLLCSWWKCHWVLEKSWERCLLDFHQS